MGTHAHRYERPPALVWVSHPDELVLVLVVRPLNEWRFYSEVSFLLGSVGSGSSTLRTRCREFFSATKARRVFFGPKTNRNLRSAFPDQARLPPTLLLLRLTLSPWFALSPKRVSVVGGLVSVVRLVVLPKLCRRRRRRHVGKTNLLQ